MATTPIPIPPCVHPAGINPDPAIPAYGTQLSVLSAAGPPEEFTVINGVGDITGPNTSVAEVETTSHSTGKPHRTFIPTLIDDGDLSFPCFFNPSDPTHSLYSGYGLENLFQNRCVTRFRLRGTDPGRRTREFLGFVRNLGETFPVQGIATRNTTIRITSVPVDVQPAVVLAPLGQSAVPAAGGTFTIDVATSETEFSWTPFPDVSWIEIQSPTVPTFGPGGIRFIVGVNATGAPARNGNIHVGDQVFPVDQVAG